MHLGSTPPSLRPVELLIDLLSPEARASVRRGRALRRKTGATVRAGAATPLWNKLVEDVLPLLKHRGEKAQLARLLGVHRQTVHEYFVGRTRMPDAERTLLLAEWLRIRRQGKRPGW